MFRLNRAIISLMMALLSRNSFPASQEIPQNLCNQKDYYPSHKSPSFVSILSQINPVHVPHSKSLKLILLSSSHLLIVLPSGLFPSGFPHQNFVCTSPLSHACYMLCPSHIPLFDHPNNIWRGVKIQRANFFQFNPSNLVLKTHSRRHVSGLQSHHQPDDGSDEMGRACSKHGREERYIQNFDGGNLRERVHLEDRWVDGKMIVKWVLKI